jgi:thermitase
MVKHRRIRIGSYLGFVCLLLLLSLGAQWAGAQDESTAPTEEASPVATETAIPTEVTPAPTEVTPVPTEQPTEQPPIQTVEPTVEPTAVPTEQPTEEPTTAPTEETTPAPTETATPEATPETSAPPVFTFANGTSFNAVAGQALTIQFSVADEAGVVRVLAETTGVSGTVAVKTTDPTETAPPYNTLVEVTYTGAATFSGVESVSFTAIDATGGRVSATVQVTVAQPTLEPTLEPTPTSEPATEVLIINYNPTASEDSIKNVLAALGAVEVHRLPQIGAMKVLVPKALSKPADALAAVRAAPGVDADLVNSIEPNVIYQLDYTPNDPAFNSGLQGNLTGGSGNPAGIYVKAAWDYAPARGTGVKVAVLDTGVDKDHPEFVGRLIPGWDFVNDDSNTDDDVGHGTHVAGIIGARTNNAVGIAGIAFNAMIMPVKVCGPSGCPTYEIAAGIIHAVDNGAKVINMSLSGPYPHTTVGGAVAYAISRNVTVVATSGNTGITEYRYPSSFPGVISVANVDHTTGSINPGSTQNDRVTIAAPGTSIYSTYPVENGSYAYLTGTSMSAPHVAGIAALLYGNNIANTPANVREAMICSAVDGGAAGYDTAFGYGFVQADWAMNWKFNSANCKLSPPNDLFQNARIIPTAPTTITQTVHSRSVGAEATDPTNCFAPSQTLWYSFKPAASGFYQISTLGSTFDTLLGVYTGVQGALTGVACDDDASGFTTSSNLVAQLQGGVTYYIAIDSFGAPFDDHIVQLNVHPALVSNNIYTEELAPNFAYSGTWANTTIAPAIVRQTTDDTATASFTFRGSGFYYCRTKGPDRGSTEIWVNGSLFFTLNNRAALLATNQCASFGTGANPGALQQVILRRSAGGPVGPIDLDKILTYDSSLLPATKIAALVDDRAITSIYFRNGVWTQLPLLGAYLNTVTSSSSAGATVNFRSTGSTITFFRSTGAGMGTMQVYVDGVLRSTVDNSAGPNALNVPYVIAGLAATDHTVQIRIVSGLLQVDAVRAASPAAFAPSPVYVDERNAGVTFGGVWTNLVSPLAFFGTTRLTNDVSATVDFSFTGNYFCVAYVQRPGGATLAVSVDGSSSISIFTTGSLSYKNWWCSPLYAEGRHNVRISNPTGLTAELDAVYIAKQIVINPAMGLVAETNTAFTYPSFFGSWLNFAGMSPGGYKFQGGAARYTATNGARVQFYINGTGMILYTSVGPSQGRWEVYVDGVLQNFNRSGILYPYIDLNNFRFRPMGYGIVNLPPGQHFIELRAVLGAGQFADFDGIRVFP